MRQHVRVLPLLAIVAAPLTLAAGGCEAPPETIHRVGPIRTGEAPQPIINGELDTANDAVCALMIEQGGSLGPFCTATIIARDGSTGYAITAAHCVEDLGSNAPLYLVCTDDYDDCPGSSCLVYEVTDYQMHPQYDGQNVPHDVTMMRFAGASASTPIIPTEATDDVGDGDAVEVSGFGLIDGYDQTPSDKRRHAFSVTNGDYLDAFEVPQSYDGPYGGACNGDSGGPLMAGTGSSKRVVGIVSQGDQYCAEVGYYARVSYVYDFVADYMGQVAPPQTCDQCFNAEVNTDGGQCNDEVDACLADPSCSALTTCLQDCTTDACVQDCAAANQGGIDPYNAIIDCAYCDACAVACDDDNDFCDAGSTSAGPVGSGPATSSVGVTTGGDAGVTTGTGDAVGAGGATGSGGADAKDDDDEDEDGNGDDSAGDTAGDAGGCTVVAGASPASGAGWLVAVAAMALAAARRRRG